MKRKVVETIIIILILSIPILEFVLGFIEQPYENIVFGIQIFLYIVLSIMIALLRKTPK